MSQTNDQPKMYMVRLVRDHEHDDTWYPEGSLLSVDAATRDWMAEHGVIASPATSSTTDSKGN